MIKNEGKSIYNIHKDGKDISQVVSKLETVFDNRIPYSNLLAYYNTKGKTNQDIYLEDFTTWTKDTGTQQVMTYDNKQINITGVNSRTTAAQIWVPANTRPNGLRLKFNVSGINTLPAGNTMYFGTYSSNATTPLPAGSTIIDHDGEYEININPYTAVNSFRFKNATVLTGLNITIEQVATETILPDLTGNGYDLNLLGFDFSGMSGYGGYRDNLNTWTPSGNVQVINRTNSSFTIARTTNGNTWQITGSSGNAKTLKFNITADFYQAPGSTAYMYQFGWTTSTGTTMRTSITSDGEYEIPFENGTSGAGTWGIVAHTSASNQSPNLKIELLPDYPDALVFDGVKDFAQSVIQLPAFTDNNYTLILDADYLSNGRIIYIGGLYITKTATGFSWWNLNQNIRFNIPNGVIGYTNNKAYTIDGDIFINTNTITRNVSGILTVGGDSTTKAKIALRSMVIFNGVNLNYEQIMNCYTKMKNNTL